MIRKNVNVTVERRTAMRTLPQMKIGTKVRSRFTRTVLLLSWSMLSLSASCTYSAHRYTVAMLCNSCAGNGVSAGAKAKPSQPTAAQERAQPAAAGPSSAKLQKQLAQFKAEHSGKVRQLAQPWFHATVSHPSFQHRGANYASVRFFLLQKPKLQKQQPPPKKQQQASSDEEDEDVDDEVDTDELDIDSGDVDGLPSGSGEADDDDEGEDDADDEDEAGDDQAADEEDEEEDDEEAKRAAKRAAKVRGCRAPACSGVAVTSLGYVQVAWF